MDNGAMGPSQMDRVSGNYFKTIATEADTESTKKTNQILRSRMTVQDTTAGNLASIGFN